MMAGIKRDKEMGEYFMRKVFLTTMSMQQPLTAYKYESVCYPDSLETANPITISIENNCNSGDEILFLTIVSHGEYKNDAEINYSKYCDQVHKLLQDMDVKCEFVEIQVSAKLTPHSHRDLYKKIIGYLHDDDEIYADITYGFKYNSIVIFTALNYAYQSLNDVDIKEICYGNLYTGDKELKPEYYDITSLFYMNSFISHAGQDFSDDI